MLLLILPSCGSSASANGTCGRAASFDRSLPLLDLLVNFRSEGLLDLCGICESCCWPDDTEPLCTGGGGGPRALGMGDDAYAPGSFVKALVLPSANG